MDGRRRHASAILLGAGSIFLFVGLILPVVLLSSTPSCAQAASGCFGLDSVRWDQISLDSIFPDGGSGSPSPQALWLGLIAYSAACAAIVTWRGSRSATACTYLATVGVPAVTVSLFLAGLRAAGLGITAGLVKSIFLIGFATLVSIPVIFVGTATVRFANARMPRVWPPTFALLVVAVVVFSLVGLSDFAHTWVDPQGYEWQRATFGPGLVITIGAAILIEFGAILLSIDAWRRTPMQGATDVLIHETQVDA